MQIFAAACHCLFHFFFKTLAMYLSCHISRLREEPLSLHLGMLFCLIAQFILLFLLHESRYLEDFATKAKFTLARMLTVMVMLPVKTNSVTVTVT